MPGHHIMLRLDDGRVLARDAGARRVLSSTVLRIANPLPLLAFRTADTHLHLLLADSRPVAGELARRLEIGLWQTLRPGVPFAPARIKPVLNQRHLGNAFLYILRQEERHGLAGDPLHDGSNLVDLLGLRVVGRWTATHVRAHLPRVDRASLVSFLASDPEASITSWAPLPEAAAAALALPALTGSGHSVTRARRAALHLARGRLRVADAAAAMGVSERTAHRLRHQPAEPDLEAAIEGQLRLRQGREAPLPRHDRLSRPESGVRSGVSWPESGAF